jgi:hypothetical protein
VPTRQFAFTLRLGFQLWPQSAQRTCSPRSPFSNGGAVALRAYSDTNGNGRYDKGEPQVGKATFFTQTQTVTADDSGTAILAAPATAATPPFASNLCPTSHAPRDPAWKSYRVPDASRWSNSPSTS